MNTERHKERVNERKRERENEKYIMYLLIEPVSCFIFMRERNRQTTTERGRERKTDRQREREKVKMYNVFID